MDTSVFTAGRKPDVRSLHSVAPAPGPSVAQPATCFKIQTHTNSKFSKEGLGTARVIGQVDCKFVACTLPGDSTGQREPVLVLTDQHAADERVRVERFLKELCHGAVQGGAESAVLDAEGVVLTRDEATLLQ